MTDTYTTTTRELVVTGTLWCGAKSRHEYTLRGAENPKTLGEAKRLSGDFESIEKARIRVTTKVITETVEQIFLK